MDHDHDVCQAAAVIFKIKYIKNTKSVKYTFPYKLKCITHMHLKCLHNINKLIHDSTIYNLISNTLLKIANGKYDFLKVCKKHTHTINAKVI